MLKLLAVPELNLRVSDIELSAEMSAGYRHTPTSWLGPTYDPVSMVTQLAETLNGQSGQLEQTLAYIDPQSAKDWKATCSAPEYSSTYRDSVPFASMARKIANHVGEQALTVSALGCGDGRVEAVLTKHLQQSLRLPKQTELFLLDVSHSLLNAAYRHCCEVRHSSVVPSVAIAKARRMIDIRWELAPSGGIPGSYGFDAIARVKMRDGRPDRRFLMFRIRRYDPKLLSESLAELGWKTIERIDYGPDGKKSMALMLLQKQ
jgi:hypothetical protein